MPVIAFGLEPGGFEHIINVRATIYALIWMCDWVAGPLAIRIETIVRVPHGRRLYERDVPRAYDWGESPTQAYVG